MLAQITILMVLSYILNGCDEPQTGGGFPGTVVPGEEPQPSQ